MSSVVSLSFLELLLKGIPEGFLDVLMVFILARIPFQTKKYILISLIFIAATYLIRLLPINYGVNTMLSLLILVIIFITFVKIDIPKLIKSIITLLITLFVCEEINLLILFAIFGRDKTQILLGDAFTKALYGTPSTVLFALAILIAYYWQKHKTLKNSINDEMIEKGNDVG